MRLQPPTLSVVIPCHNEEQAIGPVLKGLQKAAEALIHADAVASFDVLIVDDASTDQSRLRLAENPWVDVLRLPARSGYGAALKAGFERASGDFIAFLDLDGTYDPEDLQFLLQEMSGKGADFVLGERLSLGQGMPWMRRLGNRFYTALTKLLFRQPVSDVCSGYRVFRREHLPEILAIPHDGLDYSLSLTLWALKSEIRVSEVPVRYHERYGRSKLQILGDGPRFLWTIMTTYLRADLSEEL